MSGRLYYIAKDLAYLETQILDHLFHLLLSFTLVWVAKVENKIYVGILSK